MNELDERMVEVYVALIQARKRVIAEVPQHLQSAVIEKIAKVPTYVG